MAWQDQGRQYHGWFGHGASMEAAPLHDVAGVVAREAAGILPLGMSREFVDFTSRDEDGSFSGGSFRTTGMYQFDRVGNLCRQCAERYLGIEDEPGGERSGLLDPFLK